MTQLSYRVDVAIRWHNKQKCDLLNGLILLQVHYTSHSTIVDVDFRIHSITLAFIHIDSDRFSIHYIVMMISINNMGALILTLLLLPNDGFAFVPTAFSTSSLQTRSSSTSTPNVFMVQGGGLFGQDGVFGNMFGNAMSNQQQGPKTIIEIPTKNVKIGALRFVLQIHLVSEQNKPTPKTWMIRQSDENSGELQIYYTDGTAMLSIVLQESSITMQRHGTRPSLQYQLQESVLLHSVLDELSNVAFGVGDNDDKSIDVEKRLLVLQKSDAIDVARATLPTKKA